MSLQSDRPLIYLITKGEAADADLALKSREILNTVRAAVAANISLIQIREKALSARALFELTVQAVEITGGTSTRLLVNDRADVAVAAGADGVHLTAQSLSADVVRKNFPAGFLIGVSTHSVDEAVSSADRGADFAVFGPVFDTPGKGATLGIGLLSDICNELSEFPVLGLGGIDESNYEAVLAAGAAGFAAIRWLNDAVTLRGSLGETAGQNRERQ